MTRPQMLQRIDEAETAAREADPGRQLHTVFDHATGEASVTVGDPYGWVLDYSATFSGSSGHHYAEVEMFPNGTGGLQGGGGGSSGGPWYHKFQGLAGHDVIGLGVHAGRDKYTHRSFFTRVDAIFDNFEKHAALGLYCNYGDGQKLCRPVDLSHLFDWGQAAIQ